MEAAQQQLVDARRTSTTEVLLQQQFRRLQLEQVKAATAAEQRSLSATASRSIPKFVSNAAEIGSIHSDVAVNVWPHAHVWLSKNQTLLGQIDSCFTEAFVPATMVRRIKRAEKTSDSHSESARDADDDNVDDDDDDDRHAAAATPPPASARSSASKPVHFASESDLVGAFLSATTLALKAVGTCQMKVVDTQNCPYLNHAIKPDLTAIPCSDNAATSLNAGCIAEGKLWKTLNNAGGKLSTPGVWGQVAVYANEILRHQPLLAAYRCCLFHDEHMVLFLFNRRSGGPELGYYFGDVLFTEPMPVQQGFQYFIAEVVTSSPHNVLWFSQGSEVVPAVRYLGTGATASVFALQQEPLVMKVSNGASCDELENEWEVLQKLREKQQVPAIFPVPVACSFPDSAAASGAGATAAIESGKSLLPHIVMAPVGKRFGFLCAFRRPHALSLLHALEIAHGMRIVHRDVRPANILRSRESLTEGGVARDVALLIDWGYACDLSLAGNANLLPVVGTVRCGSPAVLAAFARGSLHKPTTEDDLHSWVRSCYLLAFPEKYTALGLVVGSEADPFVDALLAFWERVFAEHPSWKQLADAVPEAVNTSPPNYDVLRKLLMWCL